MNEMDVEEAEVVLGNDPVMGEGARFLKSYMDLVNGQSDGWAHWRAGTRCADDLSKMLNDAVNAKRGWTNTYKAPTKAELTAAMGKIKRFIKSNVYLKGPGSNLL